MQDSVKPDPHGTRAPQARGAARGLLTIVAGALVGGLTPGYRVWGYHQPDRGPVYTVAMVCLALSAAAWFVRRRLANRWLRSAFVVLGAAAGGATLLPRDGKVMAAWLFATLVVAAWGVHRMAPVPFLPDTDGSLALPMVAIMYVAGQRAADVQVFRPVGAALLCSVALVPLAVELEIGISRRMNAALHRALAALRRLLLRAVPSLVMGVVAVPTILVPWAVHRLVRWDPLRRRGTGWIARNDAPDRASRMWFPDTARGPAPVGKRLHRLGVACASATLALLVMATSIGVGPLVALRHLLSLHPSTGNAVLDRMNREPYRRQLGSETQKIYDGHLSQWVGLELNDVDGTYVNVSRGHRRTWRSADRCLPTATLWAFGGSTLFGVGVRDDETIPSLLAKLAARDGVRLLIANWGVPGDVAWQENRRLERALETSRDRPDVVFFYDGFNDMSTVLGIGGSGRGVPGDFVGPLDRLHMAAITKMGALNDGQHLVIDVPSTGATPYSTAQIARAATLQYQAADGEARRLLAWAHLPSLRFAQPTLWSRDRPVRGEPRSGPGSRSLDRRFRRHLPVGTIDLGTLMDRHREPIYNDDVHMDAQGNSIVAATLWRRLAPRVEALAQRPRTCG